LSETRFDTTDPAYQDLLKLVVRSEAAVVPFVGAGLSSYGEPQERLPLWGQLLERLVEEGQQLGLIPESADRQIRYEMSREHYAEAIDRLLVELGEPTFRRVVERELDDTNKPVPPAVAELVKIAWPLIVTTNLDRLIARAYLDRHRRPITAITGNEARRLAVAVANNLASLTTALAQIHGSIDIYESWRLTRKHYTQLLRDPAYLDALGDLFLKKIFFVGFGLRDDDFDFLFKTAVSIYPEGGGDFFALIPRSRRADRTITSLIKRGGLRPIFYDVDETPDETDPFGGHRAVYECLGHMASEWVASRLDLNLDLKYFPEVDPYMVERDEVTLLADLVAIGANVTQVVGLGGLGKTSLIQQFLQEKHPEIAAAGYDGIFGCSFYRADVALFIQDMALATIGPEARLPAQQVDQVCTYLEQHQTLLVLDGVEAILDEEAMLRSPHVLRIVESVVAGRGAVLITTRIKAEGEALAHSHIVEVKPFSSTQVLDFLRRWGLDRLGDAANQHLVKVTAGHPLALRILAGVLQDVPPDRAIATIEQSAVINVADEVDPLRENRLARVLGSYLHHLDKAEIAFLSCLTAFDRPVWFPLVDSAFTRSYPDTQINRSLVEQDLRPIVTRLLDRRLLTSSSVGELSCHPTVREYFAEHAVRQEESLAPIHRYLAEERLKDAPQQPDTFVEASPLIGACRHAAEGDDWTLFDDLFRNRLMRGPRDYLCDTLGAWDEALGLAGLADDPELSTRLSGRPGYYPVTVARCLKHLGRTSESRTKYIQSLKQLASSKDSDAAMYVNNLMTLFVWRGELASAQWLVELNVRALSWIDEPWKYRWQIEHGFSSFAYLALLRGNLVAAATLFEDAEQAWEGFGDEPFSPRINDYYGLHSNELALLLDPHAHDQVLNRLSELLAEPDALEWPEAVCRGHIQAAVVQIDRAASNGEPAALAKAEEHLELARLTRAGMNVADVSIAHHLTRLRIELARHQIEDQSDLDTIELEELVDRVAVLVSASGLYLATPEVTAARGALAHFEGSHDRAKGLYERAMSQCGRQGNAIAPCSPRSLVGWLGEQLECRPAMKPGEPMADLASLVGSPLSPQWMVEHLEELPAAN
jgi:hypothetical protein